MKFVTGFMILFTMEIASSSAFMTQNPGNNCIQLLGSSSSSKVTKLDKVGKFKKCNHFELHYTNDPNNPSDASNGNEPLPLSSSDRARLHALRQRRKTMPLLILDAVLPGQDISFGGDDDRFHRLIDFALGADGADQDEQNLEDSRGKTAGMAVGDVDGAAGGAVDGVTLGEIGMVGLNPMTGKPLNIGVTIPITRQGMSSSSSSSQLNISSHGQYRFQVCGEPWKDDTDSFYLADVEMLDFDSGTADNDNVNDNNLDASPDDNHVRYDDNHIQDRSYLPNDHSNEILGEEQQSAAATMLEELPSLVERWLQCLEDSKRMSPVTVNQYREQTKELTKQTPHQQTMHVVSRLLNPIPSHGLCMDIRPAMLACRNDYQRLLLVVAGLRYSMDLLSSSKSSCGSFGAGVVGSNTMGNAASDTNNNSLNRIEELTKEDGNRWDNIDHDKTWE